MKQLSRSVLSVLSAAVLGCASAAAQETPPIPPTPGQTAGLSGGEDLSSQWPEEKLGWTDIGEFQFLLTSGNTEVSTLGFRNLLRHVSPHSSISFRAGGIRAENTRDVVEVVQTPTGYSAHKDTTTELEAERYFGSIEGDRKITDHFLWLVGAGWERNRFAGVENRYSAKAGLGNLWLTPHVRFRTEYTPTVTHQEDIDPDPAFDRTFAGFRLTTSFQARLGTVTIYGNELVADESFRRRDDYRGDMLNWISVRVSRKLYLRIGLEWIYDHEPALREVPVVDVLGLPVIDPATGQPAMALVNRETLDTIFTTGLVLNF